MATLRHGLPASKLIALFNGMACAVCASDPNLTSARAPRPEWIADLLSANAFRIGTFTTMAGIDGPILPMGLPVSLLPAQAGSISSSDPFVVAVVALDLDWLDRHLAELRFNRSKLLANAGLAIIDRDGNMLGRRRLRIGRNDTPVLILSGLTRPAAKVRGLGLGADGFITRPFDRAELLARIQAIVRRSKGFSQSTLYIGPFRLNMDSREVTVEGRMVPLTGKEYSILELLVLREGMVLTKEAFLNHLCGGMDEPEMKIIDVFVYKLRKKLAQAGADNMIGTIWGRGYMIREPVVSHEGEAPPAPLRIPALAGGPVRSAA
jgi:two-component system cell cycle response regulator CtrA